MLEEGAKQGGREAGSIANLGDRNVKAWSEMGGKGAWNEDKTYAGGENENETG
ncbi:MULTISPECIES: hypothetical protein [unclassified Bartonella]|uniref:hypothetical protein n=1 Tax=unclassified Bartonella TaxID=2645622 RepID=UPI0035CFDB1C